MLIVACKTCAKNFSIKPSHAKNGFGVYCSRRCSSQAQKNGRLHSCNVCGREVYRTPKDEAKSKSGKYFCSKSCQTKWRNALYTGESHANWMGGQSAYRNILGRTNIIKMCAKCKNDDTRVLIVHHRDRNRRNNSVSNLIWLCHNCHFLIHHYQDEVRDFLVPVA